MGNLEDRLRLMILEEEIAQIKKVKKALADYIPVEQNVISSDPRVAYNQGLMWATEYMVKKKADT
jgi:hypothetical protein